MVSGSASHKAEVFKRMTYMAIDEFLKRLDKPE
jgi:hypothetical protein